MGFNSGFKGLKFVSHKLQCTSGSADFQHSVHLVRSARSRPLYPRFLWA